MAAAVAIPAIISGVGTIAGVAGQINQANAQAAASRMNAQIGFKNAALTRQQAAQEEARLRTQGKKDLGSIRVGYGSSGVSMEGSAMDVLQESAANVELDALTLRHRGESQAKMYEMGAQMDLNTASSARTSGLLSAAGTLLGGGAKLYDRLSD